VVVGEPYHTPLTVWSVETRARVLAGAIALLALYIVARSDRYRPASVGLDCTAPPPPIAGLQATVDYTGASLRWQLAPDPQVFTSYTVEAGSAPGAKDRLVLPVGSGIDRAVVLLPQGATYVRVIGHNYCGTSPSSEELRLVVP
jgi:hypothetical protein